MASSRKVTSAVKNFLKSHPNDQSVPTDKVSPSLERHPALYELARTVGYVSFSDQLLWLCNPEEWQGVANEWIDPSAPASDLVMRSAFGEMIVWDGVFFWLILPHQSARIRLTEHSEWLLAETLTNQEISINADLPSLIKKAKQKHPPLSSNEMYNFMPALALGGSEQKSEISVDKMREALAILAQLEPVRQIGL